MSLSRLMSKREKKRDKPDKTVWAGSIKPRLSCGDLYSEDKPRKSSEDSTHVVTLLSIFWGPSLLVASALGAHRLPAVQVSKISGELAKAGIKVDDKTIQRVLRGRYANGSPDRALELLVMIEDSNDGIVSRVQTECDMLGAENNGGVTCYLDTLLFAMFARLDAFEAMLYNVFDEEDGKRRKLAALIRLFVNLLRTGKLVTTDIMNQIQQSIAECGWREAATIRQQDPSEVFTFITDTLQLPLLTVKVDIAHGGKEVAEDDHKFISERLLNVALPGDGVDSRDPIPLEVCLEEYFNGRVDVKRQLERRATVDSVHSYESGKGKAIHIETSDLGSNPNTPVTSPVSVSPRPLGSSSHPRIPSLVRTVKVESEIELDDGILTKSTTVRKEVMLPAWCFFSILPFYTDASPAPVPATFAEHFSTKRPVLGLCLKRYSWSAAGGTVRDPRRVDIPLQIALPTFVADDSMGEDDGPLYGSFKLVLQSAICHRGNSVHSGHYVALIRGDDHGKWLRFDDLATPRVSEVDPEKAFEDESPYMLFYQVQPIEEDLSVTTPSVSSTTEPCSEKRWSVISSESAGSPSNPPTVTAGPGVHRPSAQLDPQESSGFIKPPVYEQHDTLERCHSPPPPYIVETASTPTTPTQTPTLLVQEPEESGSGLRPTSRSKSRPGSKDGPGSRSQSIRRSKSQLAEKRSSWASALMARGRSQEKEKRKSAEWPAFSLPAPDRQQQDEGTPGNERDGEPEKTGSKEKRDKGKGKDKGKAREGIHRRVSKDKVLKDQHQSSNDREASDADETSAGTERKKDKGKGKDRVSRKSSKEKDLKECIIQ